MNFRSRLSIVVFSTLLVLSGCSLNAPKPCFEMDGESIKQSNTILMGEEVFFRNCTDNALSYEWDFGDGGSAVIQNPRHTWTKAGTYTVVLTADNEKKSKTLSQEVTVDNSAYGTWSGTIVDGSQELPFTFTLEQAANKLSGGFYYAPLERSGILSTNCSLKEDAVSITSLITYTWRNRTRSVLFKFDGTIDADFTTMQGSEITIDDQRYDSWKATRSN